MKSDHRHHLQQNDLGQLTLRVKPWFEQHGVQFVAAVGAVLVVTAVVVWWLQSSTGRHSAAWSSLPLAATQEKFAETAEKYPGTLPGAWAKLREAEISLEDGISEAFKNRELALANLKRAQEGFEGVLSAKVDLPPAVRERALLGLARTLETTCDGDTGPVIDAYDKVLKEFPNSIFKSLIERQISELKTGGARDFYAWFAQQKPKPPEFQRPHDGLKLPEGAGAPDTSSAPDSSELPPGPGSDK